MPVILIRWRRLQFSFEWLLLEIRHFLVYALRARKVGLSRVLGGGLSVRGGGLVGAAVRILRHAVSLLLVSALQRNAVRPPFEFNDGSFFLQHAFGSILGDERASVGHKDRHMFPRS